MKLKHLKKLDLNEGKYGIGGYKPSIFKPEPNKNSKEYLLELKTILDIVLEQDEFNEKIKDFHDGGERLIHQINDLTRKLDDIAHNITITDQGKVSYH